MLAKATNGECADPEFLSATDSLLKQGKADEAAQYIRQLLPEVCGESLPLPAAVLDLDAERVNLLHWDRLGLEIAQLDQCGEPVTAVSFDLVDPVLLGDDAGAAGIPPLATRFHFDTAWPFSFSDRAGLLDGYDDNGTEWAGESADAPSDIVAIEGLETLYQPLAALDEIRGTNALAERAYFLGWAYLAALTHIAIRDKALRDGLATEGPARRIAVLVGTLGAIPALRAPALACRPTADNGSKPELVLMDDQHLALPEQIETASESHDAILHPEATSSSGPSESGDDPEAWHLPPPGIHTTGTQLRRRLVTQADIDELEAERPKGLFQRLFSRS